MIQGHNSVLANEITFGATVKTQEYWRDIWRYRNLLRFLIWRDLIVKYKQTAMGVAWIFIKAILNIAVFSILFGKVFQIDSNGLPYTIVVLSGFLIWQFVSSVIADTSNCLSANANLLSKVYFPRLILPINVLVLCLIDFLISFPMLIFLCLWNHVELSWRLIFIPGFLLIASLIGLSIGMMTASLSVKYRDLKQLIPFLIQLGMYASPVAYLTSVIPEKWLYIFALNPLVGVIDGFRWSLLGTGVTPYWNGVIFSAVFSLILFFISIIVFRHAEKTFADSL